MTDKLALHCEADREGVNMEKLKHFVDVVLAGKTVEADVYLEKFSHFDLDEIRRLTGKTVQNLLLDVDDCIAHPYGPVVIENLDHIAYLRTRGVGIGIYSNCKAMNRLAPLKEMGLPIYAGTKAKPAREGFLDVCDEMDFDPVCTWMVDDNPLTGGGAVGVLEGMAFVKPVGLDRRCVSKSKRVKLFFSRLLRGIAMARTLTGNGRIHRL